MSCILLLLSESCCQLLSKTVKQLQRKKNHSIFAKVLLKTCLARHLFLLLFYHFYPNLALCSYTFNRLGPSKYALPTLLLYQLQRCGILKTPLFQDLIVTLGKTISMSGSLLLIYNIRLTVAGVEMIC